MPPDHDLDPLNGLRRDGLVSDTSLRIERALRFDRIRGHMDLRASDEGSGRYLRVVTGGAISIVCFLALLVTACQHHQPPNIPVVSREEACRAALDAIRTHLETPHLATFADPRLRELKLQVLREPRPTDGMGMDGRGR